MDSHAKASTMSSRQFTCFGYGTSMRAFAAALVTVTTACGGSPAPSVARPPPTLFPPVAAAPAAPPAPPLPPSEGKYDVSLLYDGRSAVSPNEFTVHLDDCRAQAFQASPSEAGWATFTIASELGGEIASTARLSARGLSERSVHCVELALRGARAPQVGGRYVAYVTFR
jgi:hypothetical protein